MLISQHKLKQTNDEIAKAIETFVWGIGTSYDVQVLNAEKNSVEFGIQKFSYRYKLNNQIQGVIEWIENEMPGIKVEKKEGKRYDTFVLSNKMKASKTKTEKPDLPVDDQPQNENETTT